MLTQAQKKIYNEAIQETIKYFGSQQNIADKLGKTQQTISKWVTHKIIIPIKEAIKIEKLTNQHIKRENLRPDIFN